MTLNPAADAERWIQMGMRAVIRDLLDYVDERASTDCAVIDVAPLQAYLLACLITAGAFDPPFAKSIIDAVHGTPNGQS